MNELIKEIIEKLKQDPENTSIVCTSSDRVSYCRHDHESIFDICLDVNKWTERYEVTVYDMFQEGLHDYELLDYGRKERHRIYFDKENKGLDLSVLQELAVLHKVRRCHEIAHKMLEGEHKRMYFVLNVIGLTSTTNGTPQDMSGMFRSVEAPTYDNVVAEVIEWHAKKNK